MSDAMRESFEKWIKSVRYAHEESKWLSHNGDDYYNATVSLMWRAWQASRAVPIDLEPTAWRVFDGEGGYDFIGYEYNENYKTEFELRNPKLKGWVEPLYVRWW